MAEVAVAEVMADLDVVGHPLARPGDARDAAAQRVVEPGVNIGCGMPSTKPISNAMSHWIAIWSCGSAAAMASTSRSIASS